MLIPDIARLRSGRRTGRFSSWDRTGRNGDAWTLAPGETRVLADITGPAAITHIWMTQPGHYRECLLRITWDDADHPSILCPLGDFFGLGNGFVNSYESFLFTVSANENNVRERGAALNCYLPMPFRKRALVELVNESAEAHTQYFYIDYETREDEPPGDEIGYAHAEFRRANPFPGWGPEIAINSARADAVNLERTAWDNNYVILETRGRGHYIGCNLSVTNFRGGWWGEGDDMIWVDGYKWPPDLHGTGSEDYLNHAWGMQRNAYGRNGSSIYEHDTNGYQTSYVFHLENPVRFQSEIKVTIEHGHANHLDNEMSSVAYWYADRPGPVAAPPPLRQRLPVLRDAAGEWLHDESGRTTNHTVRPTEEMLRRKAEQARDG